jgi:GNAT superfamily N-acetyltransferase
MGAAAANPALRGDTTHNASATSEQFIIRPGRLSDIHALAQNATRAYWLSPINRFLAPRAPEYPDDLRRMFRQAFRRRALPPNALFLVACKASELDCPVGHGVFVRLGDDAGAKEFVAAKGLLHRAWMYTLSWYFWAYDKIDLFIWKPRAFDRDALNLLGAWSREDDLKYWESHPERANRWYVHSLVIDPEYQGKGIGKMLMAGPMKLAQSERVIIGLTASRHGEFLYRKLGFEMLGDFYKRPDTEGPDDKGGGVMIWYPEGYEGVRRGD